MNTVMKILLISASIGLVYSFPLPKQSIIHPIQEGRDSFLDIPGEGNPNCYDAATTKALNCADGPHNQHFQVRKRENGTFGLIIQNATFDTAGHFCVRLGFSVSCFCIPVVSAACTGMLDEDGGQSRQVGCQFMYSDMPDLLLIVKISGKIMNCSETKLNSSKYNTTLRLVECTGDHIAMAQSLSIEFSMPELPTVVTDLPIILSKTVMKATTMHSPSTNEVFTLNNKLFVIAVVGVIAATVAVIAVVVIGFKYYKLLQKLSTRRDMGENQAERRHLLTYNDRNPNAVATDFHVHFETSQTAENVAIDLCDNGFTHTATIHEMIENERVIPHHADDNTAYHRPTSSSSKSKSGSEVMKETGALKWPTASVVTSRSVSPDCDDDDYVNGVQQYSYEHLVDRLCHYYEQTLEPIMNDMICVIKSEIKTDKDTEKGIKCIQRAHKALDLLQVHFEKVMNADGNHAVSVAVSDAGEDDTDVGKDDTDRCYRYDLTELLDHGELVPINDFHGKQEEGAGNSREQNVLSAGDLVVTGEPNHGCKADEDARNSREQNVLSAGDLVVTGEPNHGCKEDEDAGNSHEQNVLSAGDLVVTQKLPNSPPGHGKQNDNSYHEMLLEEDDHYPVEGHALNCVTLVDAHGEMAESYTSGDGAFKPEENVRDEGSYDDPDTGQPSVAAAPVKLAHKDKCDNKGYEDSRYPVELVDDHKHNGRPSTSPEFVELGSKLPSI